MCLWPACTLIVRDPLWQPLTIEMQKVETGERLSQYQPHLWKALRKFSFQQQEEHFPFARLFNSIPQSSYAMILYNTLFFHFPIVRLLLYIITVIIVFAVESQSLKGPSHQIKSSGYKSMTMYPSAALLPHNLSHSISDSDNR